MSTSFPKSIRLRKRCEFKRMAMANSQHIGNWVIIDIRSNQTNRTRLGITVTRRFGKAHERNRFKRLIREAFRLSYPKIKQGIDINVKPRAQAKSGNMDHFVTELISL